MVVVNVIIVAARTSAIPPITTEAQKLKEAAFDIQSSPCQGDAGAK